jgi:hypothetical protein
MIVIIAISYKQEKISGFTPVETERVFVFNEAIYYDHSFGYHHTVVQDETLAGIADRYLNDKTRWGELLVLNPYLGNEADKRNYRLKTDGPAWIINPDDVIMLPNDAVGARSHGMFNSLTFYIGPDTANEYIRNIPVQRDMSKLYKINEVSGKNESISPMNSSYQWPEWLGDLLKWILLVLIIVWLYHVEGSYYFTKKGKTALF